LTKYHLLDSKTTLKKSKKSQKGGECGSCGTVPPSTGGGARTKMTRYAQLSKEIDDFLSKY